MPGRFPPLRTILATALLLAAFLLALVLRMRQASASMVFDEYASLFFSRHDWSELWGWWMLRETNPPLFYSVLKLWRLVTPQSQTALRMLPLLISLAQIALAGWVVRRVYGSFAAALAVTLFALAPSDIYQSEYLRAYGLAKLAVTISFIGLLHALYAARNPHRGWIAYVIGGVVAIYSHTTMLIWPPVATLAVVAECMVMRRITKRQIGALLLCGGLIMLLSGWVLMIALLQLRAHASDISWIEPLSFADYAATIDLQLLQDAPISSALMGLLMLLGLLRTWREATTRLSLLIVLGTLAAYKLSDQIHPITSDYTLHWCATFTVLLAAAALADWRKDTAAASSREALVAAMVVVLTASTGWYELQSTVWMPQPQDFHHTVQTVAHTPRAALLASHEAEGVVIQEACRVEFGKETCPFPLIVLTNPSASDSWAKGGFDGVLTPPAQARTALGTARTAFAFSRYVYTPLVQLGMDDSRYARVDWDDGALIGPIPVGDFPRSGPIPSSGVALRPSRD